MIKNHFKIALRTLVKNRSYSAINIIGLAVSLSAAILILLWVWDELSFDKMHSKADRIYQISTSFDPRRIKCGLSVHPHWHYSEKPKYRLLNKHAV